MILNEIIRSWKRKVINLIWQWVMDFGISSAVACLIFSNWIANAAAHRSAIQVCFYFLFLPLFISSLFLPTSFVEPGIFIFCFVFVVGLERQL